MSATMDAWVRGKVSLWDVTQEALKFFSKVPLKDELMMRKSQTYLNRKLCTWFHSGEINRIPHTIIPLLILHYQGPYSNAYNIVLNLKWLYSLVPQWYNCFK